MTLLLLWEEYRASHAGGYGYGRWCGLYRSWEARLSPTMRQVHAAGERLFVAVLGASNCTYAETSWTQSLPDWIGSDVRTLAFLDGVPRQIVPDNLRAGVLRANWYTPLPSRLLKNPKHGPALPVPQ